MYLEICILTDHKWGAYNHRSAQGQELIAHELTHVMQQVVGEAGTRVIQRRVMCNVMTEPIDTRFLMLLTDEELQDQKTILEVELYSEPGEESTESTDIEQIRFENLYHLLEELKVRRTVSPTPPVTEERQRGGLWVIQRLRDEISRAGEMFEVPSELIAAVIMHESQVAERRIMGQIGESLQASLQGEKETNIAEIKEVPAYYAEKILEKVGLNSKVWYSSLTEITFLGQRVGAIHTDLVAHLKAVEKKIAATHGGDQQDPKVAGHNLGLNEAIGSARCAGVLRCGRWP